MDIQAYNRDAWDREVESRNPWTIPVSPEIIAAARRGDWHIILTPQKPVPGEWFPNLHGQEVLCLACGGGQQAPVLAAAGARVTVLDNSPKQLGQDIMVAEREGLTIRTVEGDMADLSAFEDGSFDLIVHPVSNCFLPDILPVWREAYRVLKPGRTLLAGFANPVFYLFDWTLADATGKLQVRYSLPYSDQTDLPEDELKKRIAEGLPLEFGHTLENQIGGQTEAGFAITGFYEDRYDPAENEPLSQHMATFFATRAIKMPA